MKRGSKASQISDIVNNTLFNPIEVGVELSTDHRYLVQEMFKTFLHFSGQLARNYNKGFFDGRNEYACKCANVIVEALKKEELFDFEFFTDKYDEVLNNSYN